MLRQQHRNRKWPNVVLDQREWQILSIVLSEVAAKVNNYVWLSPKSCLHSIWFLQFCPHLFFQYVKVNIDILLADSKILETLKKNWAVIIINYYELFSVFYFAMRVKLQKLNILWKTFNVWRFLLSVSIFTFSFHT